MGCLVSSLACAGASCLCQGFCCACGKLSRGILGKVGYTFIFFVVSLVSWLLRGWADDVLNWVPELKNMCHSERCFGVMAVFRVTFPLAAFHLLHAIIMIGTRKLADPRVSLQDGFWLIKVGILFAGTVGSFFIPAEFFTIYSWIAMIGAAFFIVVQLLFLVDFAHGWAESWIAKYEETQEATEFWWYMMFFASMFFYAAAVVLTVLMYVYFDSDAVRCDMNTGLITTNLIGVLIMTVLSVHPKIQEANPRSGLLQAAIISVYCTYLVWSALMSEPSSMGCNPFSAESGASTVSLVIGAVFTVVAVCYTTYSTAKSVRPDEEPLLTAPTESKDEETAAEPAVDENEPVPYNFTFFHIVYVLGAFYVAMLMSDWFTVNKADDTLKVDNGIAATWVKITSSWVCIVLYIWTLVAPVCFPDREWGYN